ncbi:MAG: glycine/sarcosine/betaine reductase selenoprotein B family protein [Verrucomicrobia bacterium]|jgi:D-proline reductase (dithiol) PrdB|nr:glycine/sarcosine/betaine reductase selenoprotein B family protein [Verrucomicrobiota bacterium]
MAKTSELSLSVRLFLKAYPWRKINPTPWSPLQKPLSECRFALASSAGFVLPNQEPFDDHVKGGDPSYRWIPTDSDVGSLIETHRSQSFDHSGLEQDPNLGFPLDHFRTFEAEGRIGALNHRHLSFMGSITAPGRFTSRSAPEFSEALADDGVDAVLLVPV